MSLNQSFHRTCNDLGSNITHHTLEVAKLTPHDSEVNLFADQSACHGLAGDVQIEGI